MGIAVSYTQQTGGSTVYSLTFTYFTDENVPRSYLEEGTLDFSASGTTILGGPSRLSKRIWAISSVLTTSDAQNLEALYRAWLADKVTGISCVLAVVDDTFGPTPVSANAVFSTAPTFTKFSPTEWLVSLGLTEA